MSTPAKTKPVLDNLVTRRSFMKYCSAVAATLGLSPAMATQVAQALTSDNRPPVVWLHFAECTGCSESFLRSTTPVEDILLDVINLEYHETLMAASGTKAEQNRDRAVADHAGQFVCVVEGSIPTAQNGAFGMVGGRTMLSIAQEVIPQASHVIAYGTCAAFGGLPAAQGGPTGAKGVMDVVSHPNIINIPGCPPNPINLVATIASYLLEGSMPARDSLNRPTFAFGNTVHSQCDRPHGCLEGYSCRGPRTRNNCPSKLYNDENWCVAAEHQCIGCAEPSFWDAHAPFYGSMWASMFNEYRSEATSHPMYGAAFCSGSGCHSSSMYSSQRDRRGNRFAEYAHGRHEFKYNGEDADVDDVLDTNISCGNCHTAPGGTKVNFDD